MSYHLCIDFYNNWCQLKDVKHPIAPQSIGILGGGQLARMMALRAHALGIKPWVLSESDSDPAAQVTAFWQKGNPDKIKNLTRFLKNTKILTVESEFFDTQVLLKSRGRIYPQPKLLGQLQDRKTQKELLLKHKVPTLPFLSVSNENELNKAVSVIGIPFVLKKRRFGYDGYGTFVIKSQRDLMSFSNKQLKNNKIGFIAEPFVKFKRELAVSIARNRQNQMVQLPLVETKQKNSICHWVKGPISEKGKHKVLAALSQFVKSIDYIGIIAFEIFETPQGLLINEIAPRVHNSAHYSMDALECDQFEYHIRAISGQALPPVRQKAPGFAMVNLLGGRRQHASWVQSEFSSLHWYGKLQNRPGRKMGHINVLGKTADRALKLALNEAKRIKL